MKFFKGNLTLCDNCRISVSKRPAFVKVILDSPALLANTERHSKILVDKHLCDKCALNLFDYLEEKMKKYIERFDDYVNNL